MALRDTRARKGREKNGEKEDDDDAAGWTRGKDSGADAAERGSELESLRERAERDLCAATCARTPMRLVMAFPSIVWL